MFSRNWRHVFSSRLRVRTKITLLAAAPIAITTASETSKLNKSENDCAEKAHNTIIEPAHPLPETNAKLDTNCPNSIALNCINASIIAIQYTGSKIEKMLKSQTKKYLDLIELDVQLFECQHGGQYLVGKSVDLIEMEIIDCRMDIGELEIDLEKETRLFESSIGIGKNSAQFGFEVGEESLAVSLNSVVDFWKGVVNRETANKKEMWLKYYEQHAEIIEKTNKEMFAGKKDK